MAMEHPVYAIPHAGMFRDRSARTRRASSYDRGGGNHDFVRVGPGETVTLLDHDGPGCVTHFYCALVMPDIRDYRNGIVRCYWDGAATPAVEVPLGDFFGIGHCLTREFTSQLVVVNPGMGTSHGLNVYFPMPFSDGARITLENRGDEPFGGLSGAFWYHIEFEAYETPPPADVQRFHASYRQEKPTTAVGGSPNQQFSDEPNAEGTENYVALDTRGSGRMVGLHLQIDNIQGPVWYGEGDDMVFIDGEPWPPSIHGTGTEEIFGGGASPKDEYSGPYSGFHQIESPRYDGRIAMYRWYVHDAIHFGESLRWTVEHGHANNFANTYASVAYWYQSPAAALPALPSATDLLPRLDGYHEAWDAYRAAAGSGHPSAEIQRIGALLYHGHWGAALDELNRL